MIKSVNKYSTALEIHNFPGHKQSEIYSELLFSKKPALCVSFLLLLQVIVGILFLIVGGMNINDEDDQSTANILNDIIVVTIFLVTLINIIISGFGIRTTDTSVADAMLAAKYQAES